MQVWLAKYEFPALKYSEEEIFEKKEDAIAYLMDTLIERLKGKNAENIHHPDNRLLQYAIFHRNQCQAYIQTALEYINEWAVNNSFYEDRQFYYLLEKPLRIKKIDITPKQGYSCDKCGVHNEYAVANQPNNKFVCGGCRTFKKVFG